MMPYWSDIQKKNNDQFLASEIAWTAPRSYLKHDERLAGRLSDSIRGVDVWSYDGLTRGVVEIVWENILRVDDCPTSVKLGGTIVCRIASTTSAARNVGDEGEKRPSATSSRPRRHVGTHCSTASAFK